MGNYDLLPIEIERPDTSTVIVKIKVPEGILREHIQKALIYYQVNAKIPGFRPGFVPTEVILNRFAEEIRSDVINAILPELYHEAIKRENLKVVGDPSLEIDWNDPNLPMNVTMTLSLRPSVVIADYREIKLSRSKLTVSKEEITIFLEHLRYENAELSAPLERTSQLNDVVIVLFEKLRPPIIKERRLQLLILKHEEEEKLNTESLAGLSTGSEGEIAISYPADYPATALAGKTVSYSVKIEEIRERILPDLDDQFAQDLGAENIDDLKERIKKEILAQKEAESEESLLEQAWRAVLLSSSIDISESMVRRFMENSLAEGSKMPKEKSPAYEEFRNYTLSRLKDYFLADAVIANEGLKIEPEELAKEKAYLQDMAKRRQISAEEIPDDEELTRRMLRRKARERVKERVKIS